MAMTISYNLLAIEQVDNNGFTLQLPQSAVDMINKISDIVGATNYVKTPVFHKKAKNKKSNTPDEPYVPRPVVERTKIAELKADMQEALNKMTEKSYNTFEIKILDAVRDLKIELNDDETFMNDVTLWIFDIALKNRFSSKEYVNILIKLQENYSEIKVVFQKTIADFLQSFNEIESFNPDVDYDKFCKAKAQGEKRKTLSQFLVNLYKADLFMITDIEKIIIDLIEVLYTLYKTEDNKATCEDITDNLHVLMCGIVPELKDGKSYDTIISNIQSIKGLDKSDMPSYSNKTKFRLMDILDCFK